MQKFLWAFEILLIYLIELKQFQFSLNEDMI